MAIQIKTICNINNGSSAMILDQDYNIEIYDKLADVEEHWTMVSEGKDLFFSPQFLSIIEECPTSDIKPYYGLVTHRECVVGIIYFQSKYIELKENLRNPNSNQKTTFQKITEPIKQAVVSYINIQTIICGNLLLTGKYGYCFHDKISKDHQFYLVVQATEKLNKYLMKKEITSGIILIKDFFRGDLPESSAHLKGFTRFTVQPKMILDIKPEWKTIEDYLDDLKSKYRIRARKAFQKASEIKKIVLDTDDIATHSATIHSLYKKVSDQAGFNTFILHERYFENLKRSLGEKVKLTSYWKNGKMVAFYTSIKNFDVLDAHFLGYEPAENLDCHIYLNMLYDLIKEGIECRATIVDMSRTAIEIKSTVGARPQEMYLFLKHTNTLLNKTVETILDFVKPQDTYTYRNPFRET